VVIAAFASFDNWSNLW